jgi:hypothetical protein
MQISPFIVSNLTRKEGKKILQDAKYGWQG